MHIGVICEGPTDYHAISSFFGASLQSKGVNAVFTAVQPTIDKTQPEGGWGNVLIWLAKNPAAIRVERYFSTGLFGGVLETPPLDCLLIQLDTDILGNNLFNQYVYDNYGFTPANPVTPADRADAIRQVISSACQVNELTDVDIKKHVLVPSVESTETWCVAAFTGQPQNFELLNGSALINAFMTALEMSESRIPQGAYANIDKSVRRRDIFCARHANGSERITAGCEQFRRALDNLVGM